MIQDEIFGPVITVQRFTDEDEACAGPTASSTAWPPASGPRTTAGPCGWPGASTSAASGSTRHIPLVAEMPHGGFKHSGYGKDLSVYGLEDYTRIKHVMHNIDCLTPRLTASPAVAARRLPPNSSARRQSGRVGETVGPRPTPSSARVDEDGDPGAGRGRRAVAEIAVAPGDNVREGDVLAVIETAKDRP